MGADRLRHGRGRPARLPLVFGCGAALLAGCASIPNSGDVEPVKASARGDSQVRVYPVAPAEGADPNEIVDGFLEAMTSDDPDFAVARKYLTKKASQSWQPDSRTTVLAAAPDPADPQGPSGPEGPGLTYPLFGEQIAAVDAGHAYRPVSPEPYDRAIHLVQEKVPDGKEWRIDDLPQGLVLGESDFQRNYRAVNKYYFASGQRWLVADPVYIRQRIDPVTRMDPVTQAVKVLLDGPTDWMRPVVDSPFPPGTALKRGVRTLEFDDRNSLKVPLNAKVDKVGREQCRKMAAQLLFTLRDLTSTRGEQVELLRQNGSSLCALSGDQAEEFAADRTSDGANNPYFIDAKGRLAQLSVSSKEPIDPPRVRGPFGDGTTPLGQVAVARDEKHAAGVSQDAKSLYVGSVISAGEVGDPLVVSGGAKKENRLSAPSWDGNGDLWIADRDPAQPRLLRLADGAEAPREVRVDGLGDARIEALRVSADGVRVALLLSENGRTTLQIGRVERRGPATEETVSVTELKAVAPRMETVTAVSWAGPSRLVVVGKEAGGVQQVSYIQTDGSTSAAGVLPGLNQVTAIAAADDERQPLVADSDDAGIVRLPSGANWQTMVKDGSSPVYPG
ncbi:LpqB family beta-propeller domain-containing protein [Streptomyces sp. NBC_01498]|uniref:LpqB family beta-propeller domain-containing protein n=1 Tax=Streptomyces sp. NBC_01498 TaxID=2975870 RepID=UPI002E7AF429|nr:LpqB family beta-propeller domain-containing protein [Streptomyces sp. NBC_01498]WTL26606.1 LpqB family beta-propeller domain-containing protein [Streptomyces sp. NBC_01498]